MFNFMLRCIFLAIGVTMANAPRRSINYKPRYTDMEAYDLLPPALKEAIRNSVSDWDSYWILKLWNKGNHSIPQLVLKLKNADIHFMKKGWIPARGRRQAMPSSYVECNVKPLYGKEWWLSKKAKRKIR